MARLSRMIRSVSGIREATKGGPLYHRRSAGSVNAASSGFEKMAVSDMKALAHETRASVGVITNPAACANAGTVLVPECSSPSMPDARRGRLCPACPVTGSPSR